MTLFAGLKTFKPFIYEQTRDIENESTMAMGENDVKF